MNFNAILQRQEEVRTRELFTSVRTKFEKVFSAPKIDFSVFITPSPTLSYQIEPLEINYNLNVTPVLLPEETDETSQQETQEKTE